ncbi:hypothetical protein SS50377_27487 [Spironucleus salmonicida]|uniref:Uncharacterized protein n=1 Tax=Spironucleus salmonicida TaxID=348837 RepID=V6M168_9EUKA|nr:hypothetical protein SS50377_27487 [Spironucleus salmonicida]|eukprot:EST46919.1 hypothetical protein SS50377_13075 [Spironucleus salmonicida]
MQFETYKQAITPTLFSDLQELKTQISTGVLPEEEFLTHLHQIALMRTSSETDKIASFAPHLARQLGQNEYPPRPVSAAQKGAKAPQITPKETFNFNPKNNILEHEINAQSALSQTFAAARVYQACAYVHCASEKGLQVSQELLEIGFRGGSVVWSDFQIICNLQVQSIQRLILRLLDSIGHGDNSLWLVALERAESFQSKKRPSDTIKHIVDYNLCQSYGHSFNCFSVFLAEFIYLWKNCKDKSDMQSCLLNLGLKMSQGLYMSALCASSVGFFISEHFVNILQEFFLIYMEELSKIITEYEEQVTGLQIIGTCISQGVEPTEQALLKSNQILGLKLLPQSTEYISTFYQKLQQKIQIRVIGIIQVALKLQLIIQRFNSLSILQSEEQECFKYITESQGSLSIDFQIAAESINFIESQPKRFVKADENLGFLETFSTIPYQVKLTTFESTDFDYLVLKKFIKSPTLFLDNLKIISSLYAVLERTQNQILSKAQIFRVDVQGQQLTFMPQLTLIFEQLYTIYLLSTQQTDPKGAKQPDKGKALDQTQTVQQGQFLSNVIEQLVVPESAMMSTANFQPIQAYPQLQIIGQISYIQFLLKFKVFLNTDLKGKIYQSMINQIIEMIKQLKWQFQEVNQKQKNQVDLPQTADTLIQQSSVPVTLNLVFLLSTFLCQFQFQLHTLKQSQQLVLTSQVSNLNLIFDFIKQDSSYRFNCDDLYIERCDSYIQIFKFIANITQEPTMLNDQLRLILEQINSSYKNLNQKSYSNEFTSRIQLEITNLIIKIINLSSKYFKTEVSQQLIDFYSIDSTFSFVAPQSTISYTTVREKLLAQSLEKSILRQATIQAQSSGSQKRKQQPTTMTPYNVWRGQFIHLLIQNLVKQNYHQHVFDIMFTSKDRTFIYASLELLQYGIYSLLQLQKYDSIIELFNCTILQETNYYILSKFTLNLLFAINQSLQEKQVNYCIEFIIQQVQEKLVETPQKDMTQFIAQMHILYSYQIKDYATAIGQIKQQLSTQENIAEKHLIQYMIICLNDSISNTVFEQLSEKIFKNEEFDPSEQNFLVILSTFKKIDLKPVLHSETENLMLKLQLLTILIENQKQNQAFVLFNSIIQQLVSKRLDFEELAEFLQTFLIFLRFCHKTTNFRISPLFLAEIQRNLTSESLGIFDEFLFIFAQKTSQFYVKIRQIEQKFLNFALEVSVLGFVELAQVFSQSKIGSKAFEDLLANSFLTNFTTEKEPNLEFVHLNASLYMNFCYLPKLTLKLLICFVLNLLIQGFEESQILNVLLNGIFNRSAYKIITQDGLETHFYDICDFSNFAELDHYYIDLGLKLITGFSLLLEKEMWFLNEIFDKMQSGNSVSQQCKLVHLANKVYCNIKNEVLNVQILEQNQFLRTVLKYQMLSHFDLQFTFIADEYIQMNVIQQQNYLVNLPKEEDLVALYEQIKLISQNYNRDTYYILGLICLAAPHSILEQVLQDQTLPRVMSLQLLIQGRRLIISRIIFEKLLLDSSYQEEKLIQLLLGQINQCIISVVQDQPEALSDTYFSSLKVQDLLVTRWLAQTTESKEIDLYEVICSPCSFNINSIDLIENVLDYLLGSGMVYLNPDLTTTENSKLNEKQQTDNQTQEEVEEEVKEPKNNKFELLLNKLKNIQTHFILAEPTQITYNNIIQLQSDAAPISSKGKEPQTTYTTYKVQYSLNIVALQIFQNLLLNLITEIFEVSKSLNQSTFSLPEKISQLTPYIMQLIFRQHTSLVLPQEAIYPISSATQDEIEQVFSTSEVQLFPLYIDLTNTLFHAVKSQQVPLVRFFTNFITFRDLMSSEFSGLDLALLTGVSCLQQNQFLLDFKVLAQNQPFNLAEDNRNTNFYAMSDENSTTILSTFSAEQVTEKTKKPAKEVQVSSLSFSSLHVKNYENLAELIQASLNSHFAALQISMSAFLAPIHSKFTQLQNSLQIVSFKSFGYLVQQGSFKKVKELSLGSVSLLGQDFLALRYAKHSVFAANWWAVDFGAFRALKEQVQGINCEGKLDIQAKFEQFETKILSNIKKEMAGKGVECENNADIENYVSIEQKEWKIQQELLFSRLSKIFDLQENVEISYFTGNSPQIANLMIFFKNMCPRLKVLQLLPGKPTEQVQIISQKGVFFDILNDFQYAQSNRQHFDMQYVFNFVKEKLSPSQYYKSDEISYFTSQQKQVLNVLLQPIGDLASPIDQKWNNSENISITAPLEFTEQRSIAMVKTYHPVQKIFRGSYLQQLLNVQKGSGKSSLATLSLGNWSIFIWKLFIEIVNIPEVVDKKAKGKEQPVVRASVDDLLEQTDNWGFYSDSITSIGLK